MINDKKKDMPMKISNRFIAGLAVALVLVANVSWAEAESKAVLVTGAE